MSPKETIPTTLLPRSTGSRRTWAAPMSAAASVTVRSGVIQVTWVDMISPAVILPGSLFRERQRTTISRSVTMPWSLSLSTMGMAPTPLSSIFLLRLRKVSDGAAVTTASFMI